MDLRVGITSSGVQEIDWKNITSTIYKRGESYLSQMPGVKTNVYIPAFE